jgi:hypothetical protein
MHPVARWLARCVIAVGLSLTIVLASLLIVLSSTGVLATAEGHWTAPLRIGSATLRVNVAGLMRLATLPGVAHLLDGRAVSTRHGRIQFERDGRALRARCAPCRFEHAQLAAAPVTLTGVSMTLARNGDTLHGTLALNRVSVEFDGRLAPEGVDLAWSLPSTESAALVNVLRDAVPEASYARIEGMVQARGALSLPSLASTAHWSAEHLEVGGLGTEALQYGWFRFACAQPSGAAKIVISGDGEKTWIAADRMGPYLAAAVLAAEDQRFAQHGGFDEQAVAALLADLDAGLPKRGASSITQQLARTLHTGGERTIARKLRELLYALEMERTLGKARILELYLNTVDWGPGLCGARAAARVYFNKSPARLTPIEAAWLAGILRNPHVAWQQQFVPRKPQRERADWVLMQMRELPRRERIRHAGEPLAFAPAAQRNSAPRPAPSGPVVAGLKRVP